MGDQEPAIWIWLIDSDLFNFFYTGVLSRQAGFGKFQEFVLEF